MDKTIEIKPFVAKDGQKYKVIQITDIALHTAIRRPTLSVGNKIKQSFRDLKPNRIYSPIDQMKLQYDKSIAINLLVMDEDFIQMVQAEEANGYKVLIGFPKSGIPVVPSNDTVEFMQSKNGKRILRGIAK